MGSRPQQQEEGEGTSRAEGQTSGGASSSFLSRSPFHSKRGSKSSREASPKPGSKSSPEASPKAGSKSSREASPKRPSPKTSRTLASARSAVRRGPAYSSKQELTSAGFSTAQADGVIIAQVQSTSARVGSGTSDWSYVEKLKELKDAGFSPMQLADAGFPAGVLKGAGYTLEELKDAGGNLQYLRQAGFQAPELMEKGFTIAQLKAAGVSVWQLRREAHIPLTELKRVGFTASEFRQSGFGPAELKEAGFTLTEIRIAGFTAVQLGKKAGFTPAQLRQAGFAAADVLASVPTLTEAEMLVAGFPLKQVLDAFRTLSPAQTNRKVVNVFDAVKGAKISNERKKQGKGPLALPEKVRVNLTGLLATPPAPVVVGPSGQVYGGRSLWGMKPGHEPRRTAIFFVEAWFFDPIILLVITVNCVTMAWESPLDPSGTWKADFIDQCEVFFLGVYTLELLSKILAYGFIMHKGSYLRDSWCQLDFLVVSLSWLPILTSINVGNLSVIRSIRALRPLRALKRVPGMPVLVQSILDVLPKLWNVSMLCIFIFVVFGIFGVELFKGTLHYRCAFPGADGSLTSPSWLTSPGPPPPPLLVAELDGRRRLEEEDEMFCYHNQVDLCGTGEACMYFPNNPNDGLISFDDIGGAFIILMQAITFDDWATSMFALMAAMSPYVAIYFIIIIMIGGFFIVNLFLAVIFEEFITVTRVERAVEEMENLGQVDSAPSTEELGSAKAGTSVGETDTMALLPGTSLRSDVHEPTTPGGHDLLMAALDSPSKMESLAEERQQIWRGNRFFTRLATSTWLSTASFALVIINMVMMCLPYEGMSPEYELALERSGTAITLIFVLEMIIKLLGLGCAGYWSDGWNVLDGTIVLVSLLEVVESALFPRLTFLRVLRVLRVARALRLMRSWRGLYKILMTFGRVLPQMSNLFVLTFLMMVICALLGMQSFGGIYTSENGFSLKPCPGGVCAGDSEELPHYHFDYFGPAMTTVFIIMTGAWMDAAAAAASVVGVKAAVYFIAVTLVGRYLIFNLFIGILLNAFSDDEEDEEPTTQALDAVPAVVQASAADEEESSVTESEVLVYRPWPEDHSLFVFGPRNVVRTLCQAIVSHPLFDPFIMLIIIASSICLGLDSPRLDETSMLARTLRMFDVIWVILFTAEMSLKVIARGFVFGKLAYMKSAWNQLDFFIVLVSIVVLAAESIPQLRPLRTLRVLRVLRPLRLVSRNPGMKLIVSSLVKALPAVSNVFFVVVAVQTVFAILGMELFRGRLASCSDPSHLTRESCHAARRQLKGGSSEVTFMDDGSQATIWANPRIGSFDNLADAMRLLFIMSTGDEWETPMFGMMAATEPGQAPVRDDFSPAAFYSIAWMFMGSFFALNLFVGVICDSFARIAAETESSATMTPEQQQWVKTMQAMSKQQPAKGQRPPGGGIRRVLFSMVNSPTFDGVITAVIALNVLVMACDYWGMEKDHLVLETYNATMRVFTNIYYGEFVLKIIALGPVGYIMNAWNRFDFFLVCTAGMDDFVEVEISQMLPIQPFLLRVLRVFRVLRILRLLKGAKPLRDLIVTAILSFPSLINVGSLLALVIFMYSVLGVNLFAFLEQQENINGERNFESLGNAALLLFQTLTGDAWSGLMADAMLTADTGLCNPAATPGQPSNCGSWGAIPYFISFQIIGSFVFLNLVVAVILENFSSLGSLNPDLVAPADVEAFKEAWADFDPDADNYIPATDLPLLVLSLPPPMGVKGVSGERDAVKLCLQLKVSQVEGKVAFQEVLNALCRHTFFSSGNRDTKEFDKFDTPAPPKPPPLPPAPPNAPPASQIAEAERFALSMPSVRRVFALNVIAKHPGISKWKAKIEERKFAQALGRETPHTGTHKSPRRKSAGISKPTSRPLSKRQKAAAAIRGTPRSVARSVRGRTKSTTGTSSDDEALAA